MFTSQRTWNFLTDVFFLFSSEECRLILSVLLSGLDPHTFIWQKVCYSYPICHWKSIILAVFDQKLVSEWKILCITPYCQMQPVPARHPICLFCVFSYHSELSAFFTENRQILSKNAKFFSSFWFWSNFCIEIRTINRF